jgi:hypothetical protein
LFRSSEKVANAPEHRSYEKALNHVLRAEATMLWHGVFGGLYLRHLRQALYGRGEQAAFSSTEVSPLCALDGG